MFGGNSNPPKMQTVASHVVSNGVYLRFVIPEVSISSLLVFSRYTPSDRTWLALVWVVGDCGAVAVLPAQRAATWWRTLHVDRGGGGETATAEGRRRARSREHSVPLQQMAVHTWLCIIQGVHYA